MMANLLEQMRDFMFKDKELGGFYRCECGANLFSHAYGEAYQCRGCQKILTFKVKEETKQAVQ